LAEQAKPKKEAWVAIGQFGAPVGVKGHIRLNAFTDAPEGVFAFNEWRAGPTLDPLMLRKAEARGKNLVVAVAGVSTPEEARALQGKMVYAKRGEFPPLDDAHTYYQADLVGLGVADENGSIVGSVAGVHNFGAGPILEIARTEGGQSVMVPFRQDVVLKVDLEKGVVAVELAPWL
jgi:16S rRNA processing protein RimM